MKDIQNTIFINLQVGGLIRLTSGAVLSFGLAHYGSSEFELMAEELLMSDSVVKASRTIKGLFSWNICIFSFGFRCFHKLLASTFDLLGAN